MECEYENDEGEFEGQGCHREALEGEKFCAFHTDGDDVSDSELVSKFFDDVESGIGDFAGANLPEIRIGPDSEINSNFLNFRDANLDSLEIVGRKLDTPVFAQESKIDSIEIQGISGSLTFALRGSGIGSITISSITTDSMISLSYSVIQSTVSITDSTIGRLQMSDAVIGENLELKGLDAEQLYLSRAEIDGETHLNGATVGEVHCHEATFNEDLIAPRCHFESASHFQHSEFCGRADFSLSTLDGDVDFRESVFKEVAVFDHANLSICNFNNVEIHESVSFHQVDFNRQVRASFSTPNSAKVAFDGAKLKRDSEIRGDSVGIEISLGHIKSESDFRLKSLDAESVIMPGADIDGNLILREVELDEVVVNHSTIHSTVQIIDATCDSITLSRSEVSRDVVLMESELGEIDMSHITVGSELSLHNTDINKASAEGGTFSTFNLQDCNVSHLSLNNCDFGYLGLSPNELDRHCAVSLVRTTIDRGIIESPTEEFGFFDFTLATIGVVEFYVGDGGDPLAPVQFLQTTFSGFDFSQYRQSFEENDWKLDGASLEVPDKYVEEIEPPDESSSRDPSIYPDVADPIRAQEITYLKAKNGAKNAGDSRAAAEFFVKEMRYRRERLKNEIKDELSTEGPIVPSIDLISDLSDYFSNLLFDWTSGYGERLRRIGGWTILTVVGSAIVYWLTGGVKSSRTGMTTSLWTQPVVESGVNSLYFSIVTFTTLGYGDYQPVSMAAIVTASLESLVGVFLVGIFVYSLGKQISR